MIFLINICLLTHLFFCIIFYSLAFCFFKRFATYGCCHPCLLFNIVETGMITSIKANLRQTTHRISKSQKKNYSTRSINMKLDFCGPVRHLRQSTISDLESPSNFHVKEKKNSNRSINKEIGKLDFSGPESHLR